MLFPKLPTTNRTGTQTFASIALLLLMFLGRGFYISPSRCVPILAHQVQQLFLPGLVLLVLKPLPPESERLQYEQTRIWCRRLINGYSTRMGVPQLKRRLEPYATRSVVRPCNAVLDGPSLAYHVLGLCSRQARRSSPFEQPSYELLGRTAVSWLHQVEACGLSMYSRGPRNRRRLGR